MRLFINIFSLAFVLFPFLTLHAQENTSYELDNHIVYYNVFNSTMIPADVARIHKLVRGEDRVYVNIALVSKEGGYGIPAVLSGYHRNLMQQKFELEFIEIKEPTATYYLAPIRFNNEEILHIDIAISDIEEKDSGSFTITKKLYRD
jgi:hypothetical protein